MAVKQTAAAAALHAATVANGAPLTNYTYSPAPSAAPARDLPMAGNAPLPSGASAQIMGLNLGTPPSTNTVPINQVVNNPSQYQNPVLNLGTPSTGTAGAISTHPLVDPSGQYFQTGDPATDKFLNDTYLPLIKSAMDANPAAYYDSQAFKNIQANIEKTWGPVFQNELNTIKQKFDLQQQGTEASQQEAKRQSDLTMQQSTQDTALQTGRLSEDRIKELAKNATTIQEAKQIGLDHARQAGLTFSGIAGKQQAKIQTQGDLANQATNTAADRSLFDLQQKNERVQADQLARSNYQQGDFTRQLQDITNQRTTGNQQVDAERLAQQQAEKQRLIDLGGTLVKSNAGTY